MSEPRKYRSGWLRERPPYYIVIEEVCVGRKVRYFGAVYAKSTGMAVASCWHQHRTADFAATCKKLRKALRFSSGDWTT